MAKQQKEQSKKKASKHIREGDLVFITSGNQRGSTGKVLARSGKDRVIVEGINIRKKHVKPRSSQESGDIVKVEAPIHLSNVKLCVDPDKAYKVRVTFSEKGQKDLSYTKDGEKVVYRTLRKEKGSE